MTNGPNLLNRTLAVIAAIADLSAVSALAAQFLRQDMFLILVIMVIAMGVVLVLNWLFRCGVIDRQNLVLLSVICLVSMVIAVVFWASLVSVKVKPIQLAIAAPQDGLKIDGYRYLVKGAASDSNARVYVLVRPLETLDYWVQEQPTIDATGNWQVNAYLGEKKTGIGQDYEIMALATNENWLVTLMTGNLLQVGKTKSIPSNTSRSNLATVTRAH
jgi:hypothetical protein